MQLAVFAEAIFELIARFDIGPIIQLGQRVQVKAARVLVSQSARFVVSVQRLFSCPGQLFMATEVNRRASAIAVTAKRRYAISKRQVNVEIRQQLKLPVRGPSRPHPSSARCSCNP